MKHDHFACKVSTFILTGCLIPFLFHQQAWADGTSLKVSPSTFRIEAKPPADVWAPFTIQNNSNQPIHLTIGYKPFNPLASENGNVKFLPSGQAISGQDKQIFRKIQIVDDKNISHNSIDLGPQQKERLRLRINLPSKEPSDDYYFSIIFLKNNAQSASNSSKKHQGSLSTIQTGIGMNVLLAVGDKQKPQGSIGTFTTTPIQEAGPVSFTLTVNNTGLHYVIPHGKIQIKNIFGQTVGKVTLPSSVLLAGTGRTYTSRSNNQSASHFWGLTAQNVSQQLTWSKQFLFGIYTATLTLSLSNNGPTFTRTIYFIVFPYWKILQALLIALLLLSIVLRVRKKLAK